MDLRRMFILLLAEWSLLYISDMSHWFLVLFKSHDLLLFSG